MIFYNEAWILERSLKALKNRVDWIVAVDGAYEHFPHSSVASADGSLRIAEHYANTIVLADSRKDGWPDEVEKRNAYLKHCKPGDWVLVVDADEVLTGHLPKKLKGPGYRIPIRDRKDRYPLTEIFRLYRKGDATHYEGAHMCVFEDGELLNNREDIETLKPCDLKTQTGIELVHHRLDRPPERANLKGEYVEWLVKHEEEFRQQWQPKS